MTIIAAVSASPISVQPNSESNRPGRIDLGNTQNKEGESSPETATPLYSAVMILPPAPTLTKKVPMIDEMIEAAPKASGYTSAAGPASLSNRPPSSIVATMVTA